MCTCWEKHDIVNAHSQKNVWHWNCAPTETHVVLKSAYNSNCKTVHSNFSGPVSGTNKIDYTCQSALSSPVLRTEYVATKERNYLVSLPFSNSFWKITKLVQRFVYTDRNAKSRLRTTLLNCNARSGYIRSILLLVLQFCPPTIFVASGFNTNIYTVFRRPPIFSLKCEARTAPEQILCLNATVLRL